MGFKLYNSLSKQLEDFTPLKREEVKMYTCGPTVYDYVSVGNFRTYSLGDFMYRKLLQDGHKVSYIMNLTDVGHLTGDNEGDADTGNDRLEVSAEKEGKSAKEIANFYIQDFLQGFDKLNMMRPKKFTKATNYILEQISLAKELEKKGYTYETKDGLYFDSSKFPNYGKLSGLTLEGIKEGARVEANPEKRNANDFALWKFSPKDRMRWQEWESPWGRGFPGWHLECSAMILKELGETIDIHIGGEDLRMIHHQNEIAQSECATEKEFVKYWIHGAFLTVDGGRMGKSLGNAYTIQDLEAKGFEPLALRYFYMSAHYRSKINFTWEALQNAQNALKRLYGLVSSYQEGNSAIVAGEYFQKFEQALDEDLNLPKALSVMWDLLKSDVPEPTKIVTLLKFDEVLGLDLEDHVGFEIPRDVEDMAKTREIYRKSGIWDKADVLRRQIEHAGFTVEDIKDGYKIRKLV